MAAPSAELGADILADQRGRLTRPAAAVGTRLPPLGTLPMLRDGGLLPAEEGALIE